MCDTRCNSLSAEARYARPSSPDIVGRIKYSRFIIASSGLLISCAIVAAIRPVAGSFSACKTDCSRRLAKAVPRQGMGRQLSRKQAQQRRSPCGQYVDLSREPRLNNLPSNGSRSNLRICRQPVVVNSEEPRENSRVQPEGDHEIFDQSILNRFFRLPGMTLIFAHPLPARSIPRR